MKHKTFLFKISMKYNNYIMKTAILATGHMKLLTKDKIIRAKKVAIYAWTWKITSK